LEYYSDQNKIVRLAWILDIQFFGEALIVIVIGYRQELKYNQII